MDPKQRITWGQMYDHPLIKKYEKAPNLTFLKFD